MTKLTEFSKEEWFDVCRKVKPSLTWEEYEILWDEFQERKELEAFDSIFTVTLH